MQRANTITENAKVLSELGIPVLSAPASRKKKLPQKKRPRQEPTRELSRRSRQLPSPTYTPGRDVEIAASNRKIELEKGTRLPDGLWLGERFGDVPGVNVGTVWGRGDFQRLGRQEMMDMGFFRPFVTPEWCEPGIGCYSIIVNNDNGISRDDGDTILYAGSGGRRRGQNRTAPQSFDQEWTNVSNAALRLNYTTGKPVRVVRGPKLQGGHGTADSGGGYRYDGLYLVDSAELVRVSGLLTAMFTLRRKGVV